MASSSCLVFIDRKSNVKQNCNLAKANYWGKVWMPCDGDCCATPGSDGFISRTLWIEAHLKRRLLTPFDANRDEILSWKEKKKDSWVFHFQEDFTALFPLTHCVPFNTVMEKNLRRSLYIYIYIYIWSYRNPIMLQCHTGYRNELSVSLFCIVAFLHCEFHDVITSAGFG